MVMDDASKDSPGLLKIADLVRLSGTGRSTIHFYLNSGLLPPPIRRGPTLHFYGRQHLSRLREIGERRAAGVALAEIGRQFAKRDRGRARREAQTRSSDEP